MRFAYADPPYLGLCRLYDHEHGEEAFCWDDPDTHAKLFVRLETEFPDGWAYSLTSGTLQTLLPLAPSDVRVMAWTKPWCSFKPGVNPAYAWEPVLVRGGRRRTRAERTVRDWCAVSSTLGRGFIGAKPEDFCFWLFDVLGARPEDQMCDLFTGSGSVGAAWEKWCTLDLTLFEDLA